MAGLQFLLPRECFLLFFSPISRERSEERVRANDPSLQALKRRFGTPPEEARKLNRKLKICRGRSFGSKKLQTQLKNSSLFILSPKRPAPHFEHLCKICLKRRRRIHQPPRAFLTRVKQKTTGPWRIDLRGYVWGSSGLCTGESRLTQTW